VLEGVEGLADGANVVDSPLLVRITKLVWRPAVVLARGVIPSFDEPKNGVERLALIVSLSHRNRSFAFARG
jgi:hypothetical protein